MNKFYFLLLALILFIPSCSYIGEDFELADNEISLAAPIAYGTLTIQDIVDRAQGDASLRIDGEGRITALYSGEILRQNSSKVFPPVPGLFEFPITDVAVDIPLPINAGYRIDKGIFDNTSIFFKTQHDKKEIVKMVMSIPSVTKNGEVWKKEYLLDFTNTTDVTTEAFNFNDYVALPNNNKIRFEYEAFRPNGEKIKLFSIAMKFDVLKFSYLEGYFGNQSFDIKGDIIKINIFDRWISGGVEFENPIIQLDVDNAFGFPVRSKVNQLSIKTATGQSFDVESEYINKGIDFNYPTIGEAGQTKNTKFQFDSGNSNIGQLFKDRVVQVLYDFDAIANPDGDVGVKNFFNSTAFFSVRVDVELPMHLKSNTFTIADTIDIDFTEFDDVSSASVKIKTENNFPVEMVLTGVFLDANNNVIDAFTPSEYIVVKAATLGSDGKTSSKTVNESIIKMDATRFAKVKQATKILMTASFDTNGVSPAKPVWLYSNYGLDLKIGAIANVKP